MSFGRSFLAYRRRSEENAVLELEDRCSLEEDAFCKNGVFRKMPLGRTVLLGRRYLLEGVRKGEVIFKRRCGRRMNSWMKEVPSEFRISGEGVSVNFMFGECPGMSGRFLRHFPDSSPKYSRITRQVRGQFPEHSRITP